MMRLKNSLEAFSHESLRGIKTKRISYWDSFIWATIKINQIQFILTEDMINPPEIKGVKYLNPLLDKFDIYEYL